MDVGIATGFLLQNNSSEQQSVAGGLQFIQRIRG